MTRTAAPGYFRWDKEGRAMAIPGLTIIGESINDSVPSTKKLYEANDIAGLKELAKQQDEGGSGYIKTQKKLPDVITVGGNPETAPPLPSGAEP